MPSRRRYHHGDLRRALVDAATALIDDDGVDACLLRACARLVGVSHAAPLHHFPDRQALLVAVSEATWLELGAALDAAAQAAGQEPRARLLAVGVAYVLWAVAHPQRLRLACVADQRAPEDCLAWQVLGREMVAFLATVGVPAETAAVEPRMQLAWATVHGLAMLLIDGALVWPSGEVRQRTTALLQLQGEAFAGRG